MRASESAIRERMIQKFVMIEFVNGNLNTREAVDNMIGMIREKLNMPTDRAAGFLREAIGADRCKKIREY